MFFVDDQYLKYALLFSNTMQDKHYFKKYTTEIKIPFEKFSAEYARALNGGIIKFSTE